MKKYTIKTGPFAGRKWSELNREELAAATAEYDVPVAGKRLAGRPLTKAERAADDALGRGRGRPRQGLGSKVISITVERGLLAKADKEAERRGISRAQLFAKGVMTVLARS